MTMCSNATHEQSLTDTVLRVCSLSCVAPPSGRCLYFNPCSEPTSALLLAFLSGLYEGHKQSMNKGVGRYSLVQMYINICRNGRNMLDNTKKQQQESTQGGRLFNS